jgi:hypothetical protein
VCVHDWTLNVLNREIDPSLYWLAFDCVSVHFRDEDWDYTSTLNTVDNLGLLYTN